MSAILALNLDVLCEANGAVGVVIGASTLQGPCPMFLTAHCHRCTGPVLVTASAQQYLVGEPRALLVCFGCALQWGTRWEA